MSPPAKGKYLNLVEDADVRRWYEDVSRGAPVTADVYLRRLGSFCASFNTTPKALVSLDESELHNLLLDCVSSMEKAGRMRAPKSFCMGNSVLKCENRILTIFGTDMRAGSYIESVLKAVRSWLSHKGKEVKRKIRKKGGT